MTWLAATTALLGAVLLLSLVPLIHRTHDWGMIPRRMLRARVAAAFGGAFLVSLAGVLNNRWAWASLLSLLCSLAIAVVTLRRMDQKTDPRYIPIQDPFDPDNSPEQLVGWTESRDGRTTVHALLYPTRLSNNLQLFHIRAIIVGPDDVIEADNLAVEITEWSVELRTESSVIGAPLLDHSWVTAARLHGVISLWIGTDLGPPNLAGEALDEYLATARERGHLAGCIVPLVEA